MKAANSTGKASSAAGGVRAPGAELGVENASKLAKASLTAFELDGAVTGGVDTDASFTEKSPNISSKDDDGSA